MTSRIYQNGRAKEYRQKKKLEELGYIVLRTAGSHGFADLIAIKENEIIFIQVKPRDCSETEKQKILSTIPVLPGNCRFEIF